MKRYIAQYVPWTGGLYAVLDTVENGLVSDPKPYHEANDEAHERNNGTYGVQQLADALWGWCAQIPMQP